jgi:glycerol-3-phosphate acyltransferase PlsY
MTREQILIILIPLAYLIGSIPFGLVIGKARGIDPRLSGSGNIGASNLGRLLGRKYFFLVLLLDALKGTAPTLAAGAVLNFLIADRLTCLLWMAIGFAAVMGHVYSIFLKFKGGKGVATTAGVALGIFPYYTVGLIAGIITFIIVLRTTRYISISSILSLVAFPLGYIAVGIGRWPILGAQLPLLCFALLSPILITYKHRGNLARLRAGTEPQVAANTS